MKNKTELVKYDFVESNSSEEAKKDFYNGIKNLEKGDYFDAGNDFANYRIDNLDFDAKIPSYFHRQVVEGEIKDAIKNLNENNFHDAGTILDTAEFYLKCDAKELERKEVYLENVRKLKKNLVDKAFNNLEDSLSKNDVFDAEFNLDFLEHYFRFEGKSLKKDYVEKFEDSKIKIKNLIEKEYNSNSISQNNDIDSLYEEYEEDFDYVWDWDELTNEYEEEQNELSFLIKNFDNFYELENFQDESTTIGLEHLKNYDRKINLKEGLYLLDNQGKRVTFGKDSLEERLIN